MPNYKNSYFAGFETQEQFRTSVEKCVTLKQKWEFGRYAASNENKVDKWDQIWKIDNIEQKIEVKGPKRQCRSSDLTNFTVLEINGVGGSTGFLYGHADLAAFQNITDEFLIIPIDKLREFVQPHLDTPVLIKQPHNIMPNKQLYCRIMQPKERCMFVDLADLRHLATEIIPCIK